MPTPLIPSEATVGGLLRYLLPKITRRARCPEWPPDAFALAASLLYHSGAYISVVEKWPPAGPSQAGCFPGIASSGWVQAVQRIGDDWRRRWPSPNATPREVRDLWKIVLGHFQTPLRDVGNAPPLCHALIQICAAADEACVGVGFPSATMEDELFLDAEEQLLADPVNGSTLCREIHPSKARVLPKAHTPQNGITLGSLSHHLSMWPSGDVRAWWHTVPKYRGERDRHNLNLLLIPWPKVVEPSQFQPAEPVRGALDNMAESFGFFSFTKKSDPKGCVRVLDRIYSRAVELSGCIDLIVWPELALDPDEHTEIRKWAHRHQVSVLCGIGDPPNGTSPGENYLWLEVPLGSPAPAIEIRQRKHHRWKLDRSQIVQYGLGGQLDPERFWWEHTRTGGRDLAFVALFPWLSLCALVCEDLARQEPVAKLVRSVGPNMIIALLMDGPQLAVRWPGRYATVLADDPGSSVLTLTSVGMSELSRPPGLSPSRTVALWKDAKSGAARQIDLPAGAEGIVLNLSRQLDEEWSADGRSDGRMAGYPVLSGAHPVFVKPEPSPGRTSQRPAPLTRAAK